MRKGVRFPYRRQIHTINIFTNTTAEEVWPCPNLQGVLCLTSIMKTMTFSELSKISARVNTAKGVLATANKVKYDLDFALSLLCKYSEPNKKLNFCGYKDIAIAMGYDSIGAMCKAIRTLVCKQGLHPDLWCEVTDKKGNTKAVPAIHKSTPQYEVLNVTAEKFHTLLAEQGSLRYQRLENGSYDVRLPKVSNGKTVKATELKPILRWTPDVCIMLLAEHQYLSGMLAEDIAQTEVANAKAEAEKAAKRAEREAKQAEREAAQNDRLVTMEELEALAEAEKQAMFEAKDAMEQHAKRYGTNGKKYAELEDAWKAKAENWLRIGDKQNRIAKIEDAIARELADASVQIA